MKPLRIATLILICAATASAQLIYYDTCPKSTAPGPTFPAGTGGTASCQTWANCAGGNIIAVFPSTPPNSGCPAAATVHTLSSTNDPIFGTGLSGHATISATGGGVLYDRIRVVACVGLPQSGAFDPNPVVDYTKCPNNGSGGGGPYECDDYDCPPSCPWYDPYCGPLFSHRTVPTIDSGADYVLPLEALTTQVRVPQRCIVR